MPSSVIRAMRFDPVRSVLEIVFRGARGVYRYFDVPRDEWRRFVAAQSKGEYLNSFFKANNYPYEKIAGPAPDRKPPLAVRRAEERAHNEAEQGSEPLQWGEVVALPPTQISQRDRDEARTQDAVRRWKQQHDAGPKQFSMDFDKAA